MNNTWIGSEWLQSVTECMVRGREVVSEIPLLFHNCLMLVGACSISVVLAFWKERTVGRGVALAEQLSVESVDWSLREKGPRAIYNTDQVKILRGV